MPYPQFDRYKVRMQPLSARANKKRIEGDHISPDSPAPKLPAVSAEILEEAAERIRQARAKIGRWWWHSGRMPSRMV